MNKKHFRKRDGFYGEKLISIPAYVLKKNMENVCDQLYITHIGYFPKAKYHYRVRRNGCEDNILFYCLQGKGYYKIKDKTYTLLPNQYVITPATEVPLSYWADRDDPWTIYWIHFTGKNINLFNKSIHIDIQDIASRNIPFNEEGIKIWTRMYTCLSNGYSPENLINANLCLPHLVATFVYHQKYIDNTPVDANDAIVNKAVVFMRNNIKSKLNVADISDLVSLSVSHFTKLFKISTGMSPIDYFINLKMQKACQLLYSNDLKIKQVALMLGYDDPYYFSRIFKKNMGLSPEEYRINWQLSTYDGENQE